MAAASELAEAQRRLAILRERLERPRWLPHRLHPKQEQFIALDHREALYGGAAGGGKTDALLAAALQYVDRPSYSALILRRTYPALMLRGSIMDRAREWLAGTGAVFSEQLKRWHFPSGATLQFGYCDSDGDLDRYKSAEFHFVGIDELTEWPESRFGFLFSRIRRQVGDDIPLRMRAGTNPDGLGSPWVRSRFEIPEGQVITAPIVTQEGARCFFPARAEDNPSLDLPEYEKSLAAMFGSTEAPRYKQLRWGLWIRDYEGLVYAYDPAKNSTDLMLPQERAQRDREGWQFILAIDWGFTDACAFVILGWLPHSKKVYVCGVLKQTGLTPSEAAEIARDIEGEFHCNQIVADPAGKGYIEEARKRFRVPIIGAEKKNKRGYIDLLNGALRSGELVLMPGAEALAKEWMELPWDESRQKEAEGWDNHLADACLYGWRACMAFAAEPAPVEPTAEERQAEEVRRMRREAERRYGPRRGGVWST